jgi:hypothetical protein
MFEIIDFPVAQLAESAEGGLIRGLSFRGAKKPFPCSSVGRVRRRRINPRVELQRRPKNHSPVAQLAESAEGGLIRGLSFRGAKNHSSVAQLAESAEGGLIRGLSCRGDQKTIPL